MAKSKVILEGIVSVIVNSLLFILKMWAGIVTGSIALTADAWHTLSDSISSIIVIIAVKLASKRADKEHPFGHGRWEYIASLFIAFFLIIISYDFLKNSIIQFNDKKGVEYGTIAIAVTTISIAAKELLARYAFYIKRQTGDMTVGADAWHHRSDALSSAVVLIGILSAKWFWWIDSALGAIIALAIFYASYKIIKESVTKLLGEEPDHGLIDKITNEVKSIYNDDLNLHHFHMHNYVLHKELTFHIKLNKDLSIEKGHEIATAIEDRVKEKFGIVATVHVEPLGYSHRSQKTAYS
ncbi:MAG: cation diffusion facilitator family transporter [Leptospirales bacterium]|nr:cation diffusion facilitator family transporter [Leptospirales bacterium]